jgi:hypothetical protein
MGLLDFLFNRNKKDKIWEEIKKTDKVYPPNSISILMLNKIDSSEPTTGWFDRGYEKYEYKKFCPYNFLIMVSLQDRIAKRNPELDLGTIENFFVNELRKICVAHIIARFSTDSGINIEMYLELKEPAMKHLQAILENPNRIVSFNCEVSDDPKWTVVSELSELQ